MKTGKTKYWLDTWASGEHVECHLRWETLIMPASYQRNDTLIRHGVPSYLTTCMARFYDSMGFGIFFLPRTWECWYAIHCSRLVISLWVFALWLDLPRQPIFQIQNKKSK